MHSSLALHHGHIRTLDPRHPVAEALLIRGETLTAVGSDEEIRSLDRNAESIDLQGRTVLPGFNDSHLHTLGYGRFLGVTDLRGCASVEEMLLRLRPALGDPEDPDSWLTGRGWDQERFHALPQGPSRPFFDRSCLDGLPTRRPLLLERNCGHVGVANTRGLQVLGLFREDPFGPTQVDRDEKGEPTGVLREDALEWVRGQVYRIDFDSALRFFARAGEAFARRGITSVQSDDLGPLGTDLDMLLRLFGALREKDLFPVRLNEQFLLPRREDLETFLEGGYRTGQGDGHFRFGPLKMLLDGSLGARTAALRRDYADDPGNRGLLLYGPEALKERVARAHGAGMQVAIHCIGDRSLQTALEAYEAALAEVPRDARHTIVHCQVGDGELYDRMARLGVVAAVQPPFVASDQSIAPPRLGADRLAGAYPVKGLLDRGILTTGGSDAPVEDPAPLRGLWAAVTRQREPGDPAEGWLPGERISFPEALDLYTRAGARLSFEEHVKGALIPGFYGDLTVLREDPFRVNPEALPDLPVDLTVCGGRITWRSPDL
ncbi:Amidohydrolase 3 [Aminomonas paucivorans DSM 12260]|uniref:Amidohydrolase 3 n=1 Tax=Aminomonas paucivorans DSM 12260 TaxID=584708 RepID=E3D0A6_9BACT|nr:amidohydrolase [Aminomonas paucivorans]EFQ24779.1 Amidohydrolase 3 [Aminomonas paucivorans DSM 12260]